MREPGIFWGPGLIKPGLVNGLGSTMDLFTTFSSLAGAEIPGDRIIDGYDLSETLLKGNPSPRKKLFYYRGTDLYAVRLGDYKAHFITQGEYGQFGKKEVHDPPILYNLSTDPEERFDIANENPKLIKAINSLVSDHKSKLVIGQDQLVEIE